MEKEKGNRKRGRAEEWSDKEIKSLLESCKRRKVEEIKPCQKTGSKWKLVCADMAQDGFKRSVDEVRCKWDREKRKYKTVKDNNNTSGCERQEYRYDEIMSEVLAKDDTVNPKVLGTQKGLLKRDNNKG